MLCCFMYFCEILLKKLSSIISFIYFYTIWHLLFLSFHQCINYFFFLFQIIICFKETYNYQLARGIFCPRNVETDFLPCTVLRTDALFILHFYLCYLEQGLIHRWGVHWQLWEYSKSLFSTELIDPSITKGKIRDD